MTVRKIFFRFCKNIESYVMKSINPQGGFLFCAGWNFPASVSVMWAESMKKQRLWPHSESHV